MRSYRGVVSSGCAASAKAVFSPGSGAVLHLEKLPLGT